MQICTNLTHLYKSAQLSTNLNESTPIYTNLHKSVQIYANLYKSVQICANLNNMQIYTNLRNSVKNFPNLYKSMQIYANPYESIQIYTNLHKSICAFLGGGDPRMGSIPKRKNREWEIISSPLWLPISMLACLQVRCPSGVSRRCNTTI